MSKAKKTAADALSKGNQAEQVQADAGKLQPAVVKAGRKKAVGPSNGAVAGNEEPTATALTKQVDPVKVKTGGAKEKTAKEKTVPDKKDSPAAKKAVKSATADAAPAPKTKPAATKKAAVPAVKQATKKAGAPAQPKVRKTAKTEKAAPVPTKLTFILRFHTNMGQTLFITGNHSVFGNGDINKALPLQYLNEELWTVTFDLDTALIPAEGITYNYLLKNEDGSISYDWGSDKRLTAAALNAQEILIIDSWNFAGYYENVFYTEPFKQVLLKNNSADYTVSPLEKYTHTFKIKAPLLSNTQTLCIIGNCPALGNWNEAAPVIMNRKSGDDFLYAQVDLSNTIFPIVYKYGVYDFATKQFVRYEDGNNRVLYDAFLKTKKTIVNDGFAVLPTTTWKGAGVAIPVFSLRSTHSGGCGEFADLKLMVDWAKRIGLKLIQILPVNDTTATLTWNDSYPYAAISAFALHPMFINLWETATAPNKHIVEAEAEEFRRLNSKEALDYGNVVQLKWRILRQLYPLQKEALFASDDYKAFFDLNKHWLVPYAAFCYFRDKYHTSDFSQWPEHKAYQAAVVESMLQPGAETFDQIAIHCFVQYYLHVQLKDATRYAHENGIIVKGDIPIGIYRNGADAWQSPELYHMGVQAGAPPDDFAITGQNWGFPTYNWQKMREDGFAWWKQRFEQMSHYFDAFRIDHILGFFRIWSIPIHAIEGIMGHFEPAIPVHINEFHERGIWFDYYRYCKPYITEQLLNDTFGDQKNHVIHHFLNYDGFEKYQLKPEYATQRQVEHYFSWQEDNEHNQWLKKQLFSLISNVILFEVEGSNGQQFHFRFGIDSTSSFQQLESGTRNQLKELYVDYFFRRQDNFWSHEAMQKLPDLKRATNMLVCGEDLGLVPGCVPEVMRQLGILSLEIQRMPKDPKRTFFHPADAPYMSVVTPSTHDMSTIRGWWEEDRAKTKQFYNNELGQWGEPPYFCDAWVNKAIVVQHLYSPAMWSVFQLQDILGSYLSIRRPNPHEERINVPANPKHYWNYRMHLTLEDLVKAEEVNNDLSDQIRLSGRA